MVRYFVQFFYSFISFGHLKKYFLTLQWFFRPDNCHSFLYFFKIIVNNFFLIFLNLFLKEMLDYLEYINLFPLNFFEVIFYIKVFPSFHYFRQNGRGFLSNFLWKLCWKIFDRKFCSSFHIFSLVEIFSLFLNDFSYKKMCPAFHKFLQEHIFYN